MSMNDEFDGSQKKLFLDLVSRRIKYLEDLSVRLPKEIEEKQMEHKSNQDELMKLYNIIPPAPQVVDRPNYDEWSIKQATGMQKYAARKINE